MNKKIEPVVLKEKNTIKEAMKCIDRGGLRVAFIINKEEKLLGVITDGNIRRALLEGKDFNCPIKNVMTTDLISVKKETSATKILEIMIKNNIQEIPIINNKGVLIDIILLRDLKSIPLSSPDITHREIKIISQVLNSSYLSIGPKVKEFEKKIANYIGVQYAIAVNSGTSALHLCIRALDLKDGDEVITTPFSFIASANCMLFERAKPVFVDIDENTLCIDSQKIEGKITKRTKAILPVHIFGHPCEMQKIMAIAKKYNLAVIEDACEALGSEYKNKKVGSFGDVATFAFYPNKQITTAEGGMIVTNNKNIAKLCFSMRNQGRDEGNAWLSHSRLGYNYRMSELSAALGVIQMERIKEILRKRKKVAKLYNQKLSNIKEIKTPHIGSDIKMSWFVYIIRLNDQKFSRKDRDKIIEKLNNKGISCRDYFPPIHLEPFYVGMFSHKRGDFPITEKVSSTTIALPFYNNLTEEEVDYVCGNLKNILAEIF